MTKSDNPIRASVGTPQGRVIEVTVPHGYTVAVTILPKNHPSDSWEAQPLAHVRPGTNSYRLCPGVEP